MKQWLQQDTIGFWWVCLFALVSQISVAVSSIAIGMGTIVLVLSSKARKQIWQEDAKLIIRGMIIFISTLACANLFSYDVADSQQRLLASVLRWIPFFIVLGFVRTKKQWWAVLILFFISTLLADGMGIFQKISGVSRAVGFEKNPIYYASEILIVSIVGLVFAFLKNEISLRVRIIAAMFFLVSCLAIFSSSTRGAFVSLVVSILLCVVCLRKHMERRTVFIFLGLLLGGLTIYAFAVPGFLDRVISISNMEDHANLERLYLWQSSWRMFMDHIFAGIGMGQFEHFYSTQYLLPGAKEPGVGHAHNSLLVFLCESGLLGLVGFCSLFGSVVFLGMKSRKYLILEFVMVLQTIVFFVGAMTDHLFTVLILMRLYWAFVGMAIVGQRLNIFEQ